MGSLLPAPDRLVEANGSVSGIAGRTAILEVTKRTAPPFFSPYDPYWSSLPADPRTHKRS